MFNLFHLSNREKMRKYGMAAILVLVSLSMLLYLVPNFDRTSSAAGVVVARVGGEEITEAEVRKSVQSQARGRQIPAEIIPNFVPQLIDQMVTERAMAYEAAKLGLQITDQDLAEAIRQNFPGLFPDGKFVGKDIYAGMLGQQGTTIDEFETNLKREMLLTRLRQVALEGTVVTPTEIEAEYRKRNEQLKIQYVKISPDKLRKEAEPKPEEIAAYFKTNAARYTIPEKKNLVILVADQAKLEQSVNPTDADLMAAYNQNQANFRMPERVHARHILFMTQGKPAADEPKIKAKAEDVLKQIKAGADFAELAKKYSDDNAGGQGGSAAKGGDLDWITRGQMVPEFEKETFALKPGQTSGLVKTPYGYHIIQSLAHEDARLKPFAEVKDELAKQWKASRISDQMQQISDKAQAALQKDPTHPEKVAADLGMQVVHADGVEAGKPVPEIGPSSDFDQSLAGLKKGEVSQSVALPGNKVAVAEVLDIIPPRPATMDEVKSTVRDEMTTSKVGALVQQRAKELVDAAKANGGDLAKAAKAMGLEAKTSDAFKRQATIEGFGPSTYVEDGFKTQAGTIMNPIPVADFTAVVKIVEHLPADMSLLAQDRDKIREDLKRDKARERGTMFEKGLVDELTRKGVVKLNDDVIKRIIGSYRS